MMEFHVQHQDELRAVIGKVAPYLDRIKKQSGAIKAYETAREKVSQMLIDTKLFEKATCSIDCSFCCHDTIYMSYDEGQYIKSVVAKKGIVPNADRIVKQKASNSVKWADKACPLLQDEDKDGHRLCSIYEERPLICRVHNSSEDPSNCNKGDDPARVIRELKCIEIDGIIMSTFAIGSKDSNDIMPVKLHELW